MCLILPTLSRAVAPTSSSGRSRCERLAIRWPVDRGLSPLANSDYFQLQLIDKFIQKPLVELERQIRDATNLLETNGQKILECKKVIGDQTEATRELPDITEKIRGFENAEGGAQRGLSVRILSR